MQQKVIRARAEELGSPAYEVKRSDTEVLRNTSAGIDFAFRNEYYKDMVFSIPFIAKYQVMNSALALKTIEVLQNVISVSMIRSMWELPEHAGREEWKQCFRA